MPACLIPANPNKEQNLRPLELFIAEHVTKFEGSGCLVCYPKGQKGRPATPEEYRSLQAPRYARDISPAFEVVEAMIQKGFAQFTLFTDIQGNYTCSFFPKYEALAATAPEAICLAAKKIMDDIDSFEEVPHGETEDSAPNSCT